MFIQSNKIPSDPKYPFKIPDFSGGLNNVNSPLNLKDNESPYLLNVIINREGVVEKRPGIFKYDPNQVGGVIERIYLYETLTFAYLLLSSKTTLYRYDLTTGVYSTVCSVSNLISGYQYEGRDGVERFYFVDGVKYREYDGTTLYDIVAPAGTETLGAITRTATTVTYRPSSLEAADAFKGANVCNMIANAKFAEAHKQKIYFCHDRKNLIYSTDLSNPYYIPANGFLPPITHDGDYVVALKSFNDVLTIFKKESIFALYGLDYTDYDLKEVTVVVGAVNEDVICQVGNYLNYLGTDGKIYKMYDVRTDIKKMMTKSISDTIDLAKQPIYLNKESLSNSRAIFFDDNFILAIDSKILVYNVVVGAWSLWTGLNPTAFYVHDNKLLLTNSSRYLFRLPLNRFNVVETFTAAAGQTEFALLKGYCNEFITDGAFIQDAFVTVNGATRTDVSKVITDGVIYNAKFKFTTPLALNDAVVITYLSLQNYNDNGAAIPSVWHSKDFDYNYPSKVKQFRKVWVSADVFKYFSSNINLKALVDYFEVNSDIYLQNQITLFGMASFGDTFVDRNVVRTEAISVNRRGKTIRYVLENNVLDEPFRVLRLSGEITIRQSSH